MRLGDTLVQASRCYLHQQLGLFVLIGQIKIAAHDGLDDKSPIQMIGSRNGATRHQMVFILADGYRLG